MVWNVLLRHVLRGEAWQCHGGVAATSDASLARLGASVRSGRFVSLGFGRVEKDMSRDFVRICIGLDVNWVVSWC